MDPEIQTREQYEAALRNKGVAPALINRALAAFDAEQRQVTQPLASATAQPTQPMVNSMANMGGLEQQSMADRFQQQMARMQQQMMPKVGPDMPQLAQPQMGATPMGGLDQLRAIAAQQEAQSTAAETKAKDRFARQQLAIEKMYGGPSTSDTLFALSRALLAPRQFTGFGGTMGKIAGAFGDISQERQSAERKRAEALLALENSSEDRMADFADKRLTRQMKLAELGLDYEAAARKAAEPKRNWSENLQSYVSPDEPTPTQRSVTTGGGLRLIQYTDGSLRLTNPDGSQDVYDPATGRKTGTVPAKGTM